MENIIFFCFNNIADYKEKKMFYKNCNIYAHILARATTRASKCPRYIAMILYATFAQRVPRARGHLPRAVMILRRARVSRFKSEALYAPTSAKQKPRGGMEGGGGGLNSCTYLASYMHSLFHSFIFISPLLSLQRSI